MLNRKKYLNIKPVRYYLEEEEKVMEDIYTGAYECLEVFAKSLEGKKGNVIVSDEL